MTVSCQAWHAKNSRHMLLGKLEIFVNSGVGVNVTPSRRCRSCRADHVNSGIAGIGSIEWVGNAPWSYINH